MTNTAPIVPWYKQPWLWFLLSIPITSVILSSIMVTVAVKGRDTLVSDNYYKYGLEINQTIEQDLLAERLELRPKLTINADGTARLKFSENKLPPQAFVTLKILHPTLGERDTEVRLLPTSNGFFASVPENLSGRYYIDIYAFDESWRIREEVVLPISEYTLNKDNN